jgi:hypothetical protein
MLAKLLDINLSVSIKESKIVAHLSFTNNTNKKIFLDKLTICYDDEIQNNLFKVIDSNNNRVGYKGVMVKRDVSSEDFIAVDPGEIIENNISLDEVYKVNKGNMYTIQYYAYNPSYMEESELMKLESNIVEVAY